MQLNLELILFVTSIITMGFYQFSVFSYASTILVDCSKDKRKFLMLSLLNAICFGIVQYFNVHFYVIVIIFLLALIVEFKIIAKTDIIQIFCGASIFALHIAALISPLIAIFSHAVNMSPNEIINNTIYDSIIIIISCIVLSLAHEVVKKFIDSESIQRVTVKSKHSVVLLFSTALIVSLQLIHIVLIITDQLYDQQILLTLTISFSSLLIFYLFFLYAINLIDASLYKRYSDQVISEQEKISEKKDMLVTKIEKDDLTGVFNRRYAMNALEKLCEQANAELFYVFFVDINALKFTNDTYGHKAGDRLIVKISKAILKNVRENDIVARIGGDEFLVILTDIHGEDCDSIASRIQQQIEIQNKTEKFLVSASIGAVSVNEEIKKQGVAHILSIADTNMRKNKEQFYEKTRGNDL